MISSCPYKWLDAGPRPSTGVQYQPAPAHQKFDRPAYLAPGPELHRVLAVLRSYEVFMTQLAEAVAAAAVGLVLRKLCASGQVPAK